MYSKLYTSHCVRQFDFSCEGSIEELIKNFLINTYSENRERHVDELTF